jgi:hypothetical protein
MKGASKQQFRVLLGIQKIAKESKQNVDLDELIESLNPSPTKEAMQFVIRALIKKGFIEKKEPELRRKRKRVCFNLTKEGMFALDPTIRGVLEEEDLDFDSGIDFSRKLSESVVTF